jgi:hypothetical protein
MIMCSRADLKNARWRICAMSLMRFADRAFLFRLDEAAWMQQGTASDNA